MDGCLFGSVSLSLAQEASVVVAMETVHEAALQYTLKHTRACTDLTRIYTYLCSSLSLEASIYSDNIKRRKLNKNKRKEGSIVGKRGKEGKHKSGMKEKQKENRKGIEKPGRK